MPSVQEVYDHIGRRIAELRRARGLTQEQLAERVSRNVSYLARVEAGAKHATIDTLNAIAEALGEPLGALFPRPNLGEVPPELVAAARGLSDEDVALLVRVATRFPRARGSTRTSARSGRLKKG